MLSTQTYLLPQGFLLQLHEHVEDVRHVRGSAQLQIILPDRATVRPVCQQESQHVPSVQDADGFIDTEQVVTYSLVAARIQFLVQQRWALGASLLGITQLKLTFRNGDQLLRHCVRLLCCCLAAARLQLWEMRSDNKWKSETYEATFENFFRDFRRKRVTYI